MKRLMLTVATAALGIGMAMPSYAQTTDADCRKMFDAADTNKDGSLGAGESDKFIVLMSTKPKDAAMVTMEEFLKECRNDAFKSVQEAAAPAPDANTAAKSSSDAASTATTEQSATAEQPAASGSSTTSTTEQSTATVTTEQPSTSTTTTEQSTATAEQPSTSTTTTTEQPATTTTEQSTTTAEQPSTSTTTTTEQPATTTTTEQSTATADQPAATTTTEQPAATGEQPAAAGSPADMLASKLIGTTVMSNDNQNIGEINDIVINVENEQAPQAIIGVGGFLGIGEKNVAIELNRLNVRTDGSTGAWTVVLDTTEDELKQMPEYAAAAN